MFALTSSLIGFPSHSGAQAVLRDIGVVNPVPGPNDISQISTTGNTELTGTFNYFTDNSSPPGQTFTIGTNSTMLTSLSLKTGSLPLDSGGGGLGPQQYQLQIFSVSGNTAILIATYLSSSSFSYTDGDWLQWTNLAVGLSANTMYAYSFRRQSSGYDGLAVSSANPYVGGEAVLIPNGGGDMTYQSTHSYDAVFDIGLSAVPNLGPTNDNHIIYDGQANLNNGWQNWGYNSTLNFTNNEPVLNPGAYSLSAVMPGYSRIWFVKTMDVTIYTNFTFWANGGSIGGQNLQVAATLNGNQGPSVSVGPLLANTWQQFTISLASLGEGGANATNLTGIFIINPGASTLPTFYVDNVAMTAKAPPNLVHVSVNAGQTVRTVDARTFGINAADWDGYINTSTTLSILTNLNNQVLRWPGGSGADVYFMSNPNSLANTVNFIQVATNTHAQVFFTVNYGTGTPQQAAAWVAFCNITNHCGFKYWEVGNESGGTWETDDNTNPPYQPHDPWTYAIRFKQYYDAMKAVDPTIKIGSSADVTEDGTANYSNHPVVNPVTGVTHNGWTPVMLYTMKTNGCICDFLIDHTYGPGNSDIGDLLSTPTWTVNANNLRMMLTDYLGTGLSTNVELNVTENGSGGNDRQLVSLVSGLYWADSIGQILQTEFNSRIWWDLRNGQSDYPNSDNSLYGWRTDSYSGNYYGDLGIVAGLGATAVDRYPAYYCGKMMRYFAAGGDTVVTATSDSKWLSAYAVQRANGQLTMLVVNKSCAASLNTSVNLAGFVPAGTAAIYSYGIPQDQAAFLNGTAAAIDIATTNFSVGGSSFSTTFLPYSASVLQFTPANVPPSISSTTVSPSAIVYSGQNALLSADAAGPGPLSYQWQFGDGVNWTNLAGATTNSVVVDPVAVGTIYYQLVVSDSNGSATNTPVPVQFNALPALPPGLWTANFQITNNLFQSTIGNGIGNYVGRGILGYGTYWNILPDVVTTVFNGINLTSASGLLDDGVTPSGLSVSVNNASGFSSLTGPLVSTADIGNLLDQYVQIYTGPGALEFNGLPLGTYSVALYGVDGTYSDRGTTFVIHDPLNGNQTKSTLNAAPQIDLAQGNNFVVFTNVHVAGGTLTVDINPNPDAHSGGNTEADFNAAQIQLTSYDIPVASFTGAPANLFITQSVIFTNTSTGIITNSVWSFGDGNSTTNSLNGNVIYSYSVAGKYTVSLTVTGPDGSNTTTLTNYITALPNPTIGSVVLSNGNLAIGGTNGSPGVQYRILSSTNLALPLPDWTPVLTNVFAPDGSYGCTVYPGASTAEFFRLVSP